VRVRNGDEARRRGKGKTEEAYPERGKKREGQVIMLIAIMAIASAPRMLTASPEEKRQEFWQWTVIVVDECFIVCLVATTQRVRTRERFRTSPA